MDVRRHGWIKAGYEVNQPVAEVPELIQFGEQWAEAERFWCGFHEHQHWEIHLQVEGCMIWETESDELLIEPSQAYLCPPGVMHRYLKCTTAHVHFFFVVFDIPALLAGHGDVREAWREVFGGLHGLHHLPDATALVSRFKLIDQELRFERVLRREKIWLELQQLAIETIRSTQPVGVRQQDALNLHAGIAHSLRLLEEQFTHPWSIEELARVVHLSPSHFAHLFKEQIGTSPYAYLQRQRLQEARRLLINSSKSISDISQEVGFSSSQHFATVFREAFGVTPSRMRRGDY